MTQNYPLKRRQAAAQLGVCVSTLDKLLRTGALPKVTISAGRIGILQSDVDTYIERNRTNAAQ